MASKNTEGPEKMQFYNCAMTSAGGSGGWIGHPQPRFPDQRDRFISWLRAEFAAANGIIDALCHHLRSMGDPGEYDLAMGCVKQRRVSWNPVLHMQQFFPVTEIMHSLQQVEWRRRQRAGKELRRSVALNFRESDGAECRNLNANASIVGAMESNGMVKEREQGEIGNDGRKSDDQGLSDVRNATVDGSRETSRNPDGANIPSTESRLKDVKVEKISNSQGDVLYDGDHEANRPPPGFEARSKWSHDEDLHLIKAWLNTDARKKSKPFWTRIADYYWEGKLEKWVGRSPSQCEGRWNRINEAVLKFVGCYEEACKQKNGEESVDNVIIRRAYQLYQKDIGEAFLLEHAWRALRSESKWRDAYLKATTTNTNDDKRMKIGETGRCSLSSSSTAHLSEGGVRSLKRKAKGRGVEKEGSGDSEASSQMVIGRDERKTNMRRECLVVKKYVMLSKLVAKSGSLSSEEVMAKNRLIEDLLKQ